ncbi:MAG TPA: DNA polymerase [Candidatus Paceibacterota bacterium]|nr:DNA polymerase [Candidatus Paceibacterota bacterium]
MSNVKKRLVILDTHAILHRAYHALPDFASSKGEPTGALYGLISMLVRIAGELEPDYIAAAFDLPKPTHRHIAYEKYKSHRPKADDALVSQIIASREVLKAFGVALYEQEGFEADDIIGTIVEKMKKKKDLDIIIASGDMDTMQLIEGDRVQVFTLKMGLTDTVLYDEEGVKRRYGFGPELIPDFKGLRGDPSDNIPGIKGVGEKTATILISQFGTVEDIYKVLKKNPEKIEAAGIKGSMLEKIKAAKEDAEFSKTLAIIRRDAPIDFSLPEKEWKEGIDTKEVEDVLSRYEFRSLVPRVRSLVESISEDNVKEAAIPGDELFAESAEDIPQDELAKATLAVSVLDSNIAQPTIEDVYRAGHARNFEEARKNILAEIAEHNLNFVYENIELPLMPVLRQMERKGVCIDKKFLAKLSKDYHAELDKIAGRIYEAAGEEFNINSPKQLGDILFDKLELKPARQKKTATGARSTRESELEKMRDLHPIVADILSYRELAKLLGTYIDNLPTLLDEHNRVHTTFIQIGAATGRIATQNPGLQNIPIKTELGRAIREAFIAEKGYQMVSFDYSQIELRIAAWLSHDPGLTQIFKDGRDVHAEVASRVFHVRMEDVSYEQRRRAKVINFGILYGMGVNALQQTLATTRAEAQEFYNQYFAAFPRLAAYLDEAKAFASTNGYISTYFGRRRYLDGIKSPIPYIRAAAERMAINAPMQGTQADIVKLAMVRIVDYLKAQGAHDGAHMLLQVHDELVFEIADDKVAALAPKIKEIMENVVPESERNGIPFIAEGKAGKNWGEMEKLKL